MLRSRTFGAVLVGVVLVAVSFLNDPSGYLGTDTGGKTATLEAMSRWGSWDVDVGYWAAAHDPDGRFHPLYGTNRTDDGYVQVTSVPMILAAKPLWEVGGYRAALLLPIAGAVAAALAASALARRLAGPRAGTLALWVFGLASPLAVYGLDLWEHSLGVAAIGWAVVLLFDLLGSRGVSAIYRGVAAGALLAFAATMRTEALVYTLVLVAGTCTWLLVRRGVAAALGCGVAAVGGFVPVWLVNRMLEVAVGGTSRTSRATGAASDAGSEWAVRLEEGVRTTFATAATDGWASVILGVLLVGAIASAVGFGDRVPPDRRPMVAIGLGALVLLVVASGLGFVPGLFAAFPVAAAAMAWNRLPGPGRALVVPAAAALPLVWAFQFIGGAGPQWGGRYVLGSAFLLGVAGVVAMSHGAVPREVVAAVVTMSVVVTVFGLAWLRDRSHDVDRLFDWVVQVQDEALVARNPFFLRESGPVALEHRWLSAQNPDDLESPSRVLVRAGIGRFSVLQVEGEPEPRIEGFDLVGADRHRALGVVFEVVHLRAVR